MEPRAESDPLVSVIVVNWNGRPLLPPCLDSLRTQTFRSFETILVDNGSRDGSAEEVERSYPEVGVIRLPRNLGFAAANNVGYRRARGRAIALLNNDARADPRWLEALVDAMGRNPEFGFFASRIVLEGRPDTVDACGDYYTPEGFAGKIGYLGRADAYPASYPVAGACAAGALYRRRLFEDAGLFDEDFFMTHEDTDLSLRAHLMGHPGLYVPAAGVVHRMSASLQPGTWRQLFLTWRNEEYAYLKNMPDPLLRRSFLAHALRNLRRFAGALRHAGLRGLAAFAAAKAAVLWNLPGVLRKRRRIQARRRISAERFAQILTRADEVSTPEV